MPLWMRCLTMALSFQNNERYIPGTTPPSSVPVSVPLQALSLPPAKQFV